MGKVLRCVDEETGAEVAVKVIRDDLEDPIHRHRFARECEAARRVRSRHVAKTIETGECPLHGTYLAMELLSGETLTKRLTTKGPMKVSEAIELGSQLLEALAAIHAAGVVHRDLKPSNVHVGFEEGDLRAVLFDFGVCSIPGTTPLGSQLTDPARPIGTLRYMAPEQIVHRERIGPATDVYGWGCVVWVTLTGTRPFPKVQRTSELVEAIVKTNHAAPHTKRPQLPRGLSVLVAQAMSVSPSARPTVPELRAALAEMSDRTVNGMKAPAYRPPPPPPPVIPLAPRRKKRAQSKPAPKRVSKPPPPPPPRPKPRPIVPRKPTLVGQPVAEPEPTVIVEPLRPHRVFASRRAHDLPPGRSSLPSWQLVRRSASTPTHQRKTEHAALTTVLPGELRVRVLLGVSTAVFGAVIGLLALAFS